MPPSREGSGTFYGEYTIMEGDTLSIFKDLEEGGGEGRGETGGVRGKRGRDKGVTDIERE